MHKYTRVFVLLSLLVPIISLAQTANPNAYVETIVRGAFSDIPNMITIAKCESGFRQFAPDGSVLRGGTGKNYIGIFQISESVHKAKALSMGYDINTVEGNIGYAHYQYSVNGTGPWISCLGSTPVVAAPTDSSVPQSKPTVTTSSDAVGALNVNLSYGMVKPDVVTLQKILNKIGFVVSASGPGSPGQETAMFGSLTREAVRKFQCAKKIVCDGSEATTGYGRVGPMTRSLLNQL